MKIINMHVLMAATLLSMTGSNAAANTVCPCDKDCKAGFKTRLRIAPVCEVDTFPDSIAETLLAADPAAVPLIGDHATLDGDVVFNATNPGEGYWREYEIIDESGNITDTLVGTKGAKSFDSLALFRLSCVNRDQKGFAKLIANGCFLVAMENKNGQWEMIGNPDNPAHVESIVLSRGALAADANEGTYSIKANTGCTAMDYDGVFDLTPNP